MEYKKIYYYIISLITFFILLWGAIDFVSASINLTTGKFMALQEKSSEPAMDEYYQQRVAQDRMFDSLARMLISGSIFLYSKYRLSKIERT
ncbi:MAG: hypothetical protein FD145_302 [Candidatus Saganbacteria bacterium]|uniref:Uncharacterized protein n=1 Tax=Candidatus Saganbacteria bacterium TaxID=2575572 RepID=A0A833L211_UNCSA|nr:MAG: hypothetical protein FD145_302 [Candidatus Saganbacteria bacterium]